MEVDWATFGNSCAKAFHIGDVAFFAALKKIRHLIHGFANLDDLGEVFAKFGPGFEEWNKLVAEVQQKEDEASSNQRLYIINDKFPAPEPDLSLGETVEDGKSWIIFVNCFNRAYYSHDVDTLNILRSIGVYGFVGLDKVGPQYEHYGPGFVGWYDLLEDLKK